MTALLEVKNLGAWFYTRQGIVKAVEGADSDDCLLLACNLFANRAFTGH